MALEKPTDREQGEWYLQRYIAHLPAAGEVVFFDRSWYNRAGVERVMGFCSPEESLEFLHEAPEFERMLARDGITLIKFWFSVSRAEQLRRFAKRQLDPVKQWKLSPVDLASLDKWDDYTEAKEAMFFFTDLADAPWTVVKSNDKKRARLEAMRYVLRRVDYEGRNEELVGQPDPLIVGPVPLLHESGEGSPAGLADRGRMELVTSKTARTGPATPDPAKRAIPPRWRHWVAAASIEWSHRAALVRTRTVGHTMSCTS